MPSLPNKDLPSRIHTPKSYFEPLPLNSLFEQQQPLEVEIGCGNGSFLVNYAEENQKTNFIGIERLLGRIRKLDRKTSRRGLMNVAIVRVEAAYGIQYMLPPASVQAYHIYFPDPWPKRKHWKNRLIEPGFLPLLSKSLSTDGKVYLRTDNTDYFEQMEETFAGDSAFERIKAPDSLTQIVTDFEKTFNAQGIPTLRAQYRLRKSGSN
ncbi:MAG: tRNA (guanosine(46)-N7)-methyltransferase TrmB [Verrucomicrobia bacterium]|jgi:tRNA (guanine-N7-)-methyltransferase|nr:tRNA (guanosine(46)-N7)-methyltransferase TrmB [Verrucomicrobiota bacterium]MDB4796693.1 tRNA (guanosine(46)-N7)-methyltransferase TrmB [bacterium]